VSTLRGRFAAALAVVALVAVAVALLLSFEATRRLLGADTRQTFDGYVGAVVDRARGGDQAPDDFTGDDPSHDVLRRLVESRQVVAQVLGPDGAVLRPDPGRTALPVAAADRALAAAAEPGGRAERTAPVAPGEDYRLVTVAMGGGRGAVEIGQALAAPDRLLARLAQLMTVVGLGVVLVACLAGWLVARRVTGRLQRLIRTAERVTASGRLDVRVGERDGAGRDEVGRLGAAFDAMLDELGRAREAQRRLVQDAGHELRTPLTSVRANVAVLHRMDELEPAQRAEVVADLDSETRELATLLEELVELAVDQRAEEPVGPVDLAGLAERVAARAAARTGREITVRAAGRLRGRPAALERALTNLVDNAAKFAPGGPIEIVADPDRLVVRDRGPGLPAGGTTRIFDRFYRAPDARGLPGSGLGLAIVAAVAAAHGGTAFAEDRAGGGAAVGFTLGAPTLGPGLQPDSHRSGTALPPGSPTVEP
jgi:two-component system sensor histidine kinase MprB